MRRRSILGRAVAAGLVVTALSSACASLDGLTGGDASADVASSTDVHAASDGGHDAKRDAAHDGARDAPPPNDGTVADSGSDVVRDSGAHDAGAFDAGNDAPDAGVDAFDAYVSDAPIPDAEVCGSSTVDPLTDPANCGRCGHSCLGGACSAGACQPFVVTSGTWGTGAVAADSTYVYWQQIENGCDCYTDVYRLALTGDAGAPEKLAPLVDNPTDPIPYGGLLYYGLIYSNAIVSLSAAGVVATLTTDVGQPAAVAVDGTSVYWTDTSKKAVLSVPIAGGGVSTIAAGTADMTDIAVDNQYVYWSEPSENAVLKAVKLAGSTPITLTSVLPDPEGIAAQSGNVYFAANALAVGGGGIYTVPHGGTGFTELAAPSSGSYYIAIDSSYVYFTGAGVGKAPLSGGQTTTLQASGDTYGIAASADSVFWVGQVGGTATLYRLAK